MNHTYVRRELRVYSVESEIDRRPKAPDIENGVIVLCFDVGQLLCVSELLLDCGIIEELLVVGIVGDAVGIDGRVRPLDRGKVDVVFRPEYYDDNISVFTN